MSNPFYKSLLNESVLEDVDQIDVSTILVSNLLDITGAQFKGLLTSNNIEFVASTVLLSDNISLTSIVLTEDITARNVIADEIQANTAIFTGAVVANSVNVVGAVTSASVFTTDILTTNLNVENISNMSDILFQGITFTPMSEIVNVTTINGFNFTDKMNELTTTTSELDTVITDTIPNIDDSIEDLYTNVLNNIDNIDTNTIDIANNETDIAANTLAINNKADLDSDVYFDRIKLGPTRSSNTIASTIDLNIQSTDDVVVLLEADTNNSGEGDNPSVCMKQDGGFVSSLIGIVETDNKTCIKTYSSTGTSNQAFSVFTGGKTGPVDTVGAIPNVTIPATERFTIDVDGNATFNEDVHIAGTLTGVNTVNDSLNYTGFTLYNNLNISSVSTNNFRYQRLGDMVYCSFAFNLDPTSGFTTASFSFAPPVASSFSNEWECIGHVSSYYYDASGIVYANIVNNRIQLNVFYHPYYSSHSLL